MLICLLPGIREDWNRYDICKETLNGHTDEFWFWADEEKMMAVYANKTELSILFQKKFNADFAEVMKFCITRDVWESFRVSADKNVIVFTQA